MFTELLKQETRSIRGKTFTFYEISSLDWIRYLVTEDEAAQDDGVQAQALRNRSFLVHVIAAALTAGVEEDVPTLVQQMETLPDALIGELFAAADAVNGITDRLDDYAGKASPADATAAV